MAQNILICIAVFCIQLLNSTDVISQRIAAGGRHSLVVCADSTVQAWGYNGFGQLGNGNDDEQHSGVPIAGLRGIIQVAGGLFHSLFVKHDGTVWSCGRNPLGNLGDGTNENKQIPVQVLSIKDVIQVAGGGEHSLFLKQDGTVWACGNNSSGQLGDGTTTNKNIPIQVVGLNDIIQIAAGAEYSLFLKRDGTVWACGHNGFGQLGNGTNTTSKSVIQVFSLSNVVQLSAGEWHSLFVTNDGNVFSCGRNQYGQLGDGTIVNNNTATRITSLSNIKQAEAGGIHSVFLKNDNTVWACGLNSGGNNDGQLGDGTIVDKHLPVQVIPNWGGIGVERVEATREHSLFLLSNGLTWAAGRNNYGQLGNGKFSSSNSSSPILSSAICKTNTSTVTENPNYDHNAYIFPNPCNGTCYLKTDHVIDQIEIYNMFGKRIKSYLNNKTNNQIELHFSNEPNGLYLIKCLDSNLQLFSRKILVQGN